MFHAPKLISLINLFLLFLFIIAEVSTNFLWIEIKKLMMDLGGSPFILKILRDYHKNEIETILKQTQ